MQRNMKKIVKAMLAVCALAALLCLSVNASAAAKTSVKILEAGKSYTIKNTSKVKSSKTSVATAKKKSSTKYKITGKKKGASTLSVYNKSGKLTQKVYLLVYNSKTFKYNTDVVNLAKGKTKTVKASTNKTGVSIKYSSSNKNVATVNSNGKITAKKTGKATISAKFYYKGTKVKTRKKTVNVYSSSYNTDSISLTEGKTKTVSASLSSNCTAKYSSSNTSIAKVNSSGKITAVKKGTATITCKIYLGKTNVKTYTKKVTVNAATTNTASSSSSYTYHYYLHTASGVWSKAYKMVNSEQISYDVLSGSGQIAMEGGNSGYLTAYTNKSTDTYSIKLSNDCLELSTTDFGSRYNSAARYQCDEWYTTWNFIARKKGTCDIKVYRNGSLKQTISVSIASTDDNYYTYQNWKADIKSMVWYSGMTDLQKLKSFGDYACDTCYYKTSGSKYSLACAGYGDCWSMTSMMIDIANDLGYEAEAIRPYYDLGITGYSPNHYFAKVYNLNGADYYYFQATNSTGNPYGVMDAYRNGKLEEVEYDKRW